MAAGKWIGGFLGFITAGPLGALAGFALGSLFDHGLDEVNKPGNNEGYNNREYYNNAYDAYTGRTNQQSNPFGSSGYGSSYGNQQRAYEGERNSFMFSLLVLSSYIINADGKIMHSEMECVRSFLRRNFGEIAVQQGEQILLRLFERQKQMGTAAFNNTIREACAEIAQHMEYSQRLQLLNFLVLIAQADGSVPQCEIDALQFVAANLGISAEDLGSMLNLSSGASSLEAAYKVLGISPDATDDEVKAAYRQMALKHHPDRVATLGEDVRKAAEKKFQEINAAKETIYKARGL